MYGLLEAFLKMGHSEKPIFTAKSGSKNVKETWGERPEKCTATCDSSLTFRVPSDSLIKEATNWLLSMDLEE